MELLTDDPELRIEDITGGLEEIILSCPILKRIIAMVFRDFSKHFLLLLFSGKNSIFN